MLSNNPRYNPVLPHQRRRIRRDEATLIERKQREDFKAEATKQDAVLRAWVGHIEGMPAKR